MKAYMVTTGRKGWDLECQIVEPTKAGADKEARDLRKMGCEQVKVREFASEAEAYAWLDKAQGL